MHQIQLSDNEIEILSKYVDILPTPIQGIIKRMIYQANDSPIFCSAYNKPIKHLNPQNENCQPFPYACNKCPLALFEE